MRGPSPVSIATLILTILLASAAWGQRVMGTPRFVREPLETMVQSGAHTVTHWDSEFLYEGLAYRFSMVGTNPDLGSATTVVPAVIVPVDVSFAVGGAPLNAGSKVALVEQSPLFRAATFASGATQYGDAVQRANFWEAVQFTSPGWHVLLSAPTVLPAQKVLVPRDRGTEIAGSHARPSVGMVERAWWSQQVRGMLQALRVSPDELAIFVTDNVFLYDGAPSNCCVVGYHAAVAAAGADGRQEVRTYLWASYTSAATFGVPLEDVGALSHELAEWLNDPFVRNMAPPWTLPQATTGNCENRVEAGAPLVGKAFAVRSAVNRRSVTYHLQDAAFLAWFSRYPSNAYNGWYSYLGTLQTSASGC